MRLRQLLRGCHRWLGAMLCVLFVVWFASGIVLTFAGFPSLSERERLANAAPLEARSLRLRPAAALSGVMDLADSVVLEALGRRAVYKVYAGPRTVAVFADNGSQVTLLDERTAVAAVAPWLHGALPEVSRISEVDQWTPQANQHGELPFLRLRVPDAAGTELYVSLVNGNVVQQTSTRSRFLAWVGAIPHWIYPIQLRRHRGAWRALVIALAALGALASATGLIHGLATARTARRLPHGRQLPLSPFQDRWLAWHHLLGLVFGLLSFSWVFSGLLSFYPFASSAEGEPTWADIAAFRGGALAPRSFSRDLRQALAECENALGSSIKRIEFVRAGGAPFYICKNGAGAARTVSADAAAQPGATLRSAQIVAFARPLGGAAAVKSETWLQEGDAYYYPSHFEPDLPFPILRTRFAGGLVTYVSSRDLSVIRRYSNGGAAYRWLYHGLHSLDLPFLYRRAWLWHPLIVIALLGGLTLAASSAWLSVRWSRRHLAQRSAMRSHEANAS